MKKLFYTIFLSFLCLHANIFSMRNSTIEKRTKRIKKLFIRPFLGKMEDKHKGNKKIFMECRDGGGVIRGFFTPRKLEIEKYTKKIRGLKLTLSKHVKSIDIKKAIAIFSEVDKKYKKFRMLNIKDKVNSKNRKNYIFSQFYDKTSLLKVWKNLQELKVFLLKNEYTNSRNKRFNKLEAENIKNIYLCKCLAYYKKNYSQSQVYTLVCELDAHIKKELSNIKIKEKLYNQYRKLVMRIQAIEELLK